MDDNGRTRTSPRPTAAAAVEGARHRVQRARRRLRGVFAIATALDHRRRGLGEAVTRAVIVDGVGRGATRAVLQASDAGRPLSTNASDSGTPETTSCTAAGRTG